MKKILVGLLASGVVLGSAVIASAGWYACTPQALGASDDLKRFKVACDNDPSGGKDGWLTLSPGSADQQMATVLTAIATDKQVSVQVTGQQDSQGYNIADYVIVYK